MRCISAALACAATLVALGLMPTTAGATSFTLTPNAASGGANVFKQLATCSNSTATLETVIDDDPDSPNNTTCSAGSAGDYIYGNLPTLGSTASKTIDFLDAPVAVTTTNALRLRLDACSTTSSSGNTLDIDLRTTGNVLVKSFSFAIDQYCGAGGTTYDYFLTYNNHPSAGLTNTEVDNLHADLTMTSGDNVATTVRVSAIAFDALYCAAGQTVCGVAYNSMQNAGAPDVVWPGCTGVAGNLSVSVNGGAPVGIACDPTTGEYSSAAAVASGQMVVVYMSNGARPTDYGAAYVKSSGAAILADVAVQRTAIDTYSTTVTNADISVYDGSAQAKLPVDVTGSDLAETHPTTMWIDMTSGTTYTPGGNVTVSSLTRWGALSMSGLVLTVTSTGTGADCSSTLNTHKPVCNWSNATSTTSGVTVRYTGSGATTAMCTLTVGSIELRPASGTTQYHSGNANITTTGSFMVGDPAGVGIVNLNMASVNNLSVGTSLTVNANSSIYGAVTNPVDIGTDFTGAGTVNVTGWERFTLRGTGNRVFGPTGAATPWTLSEVAFETSNATPRTITMASAGSGLITMRRLEIGTASDGAITTFDLNTNDRPVTLTYGTASSVTGQLRISTKGALLASNTQPLEVRNDFIVDNPTGFTNNGGTITINPAVDGLTQMQYSAPVSFATLDINGPGRIEFDNAFQTNVSTLFDVAAGGCTPATRVTLASDVFGSQWEIDATGATSNVNAVVQDSRAITAINAVASSYDAGNNTNWTFAPGACLPLAPNGFQTEGATQPVTVGVSTPAFSSVNQATGTMDQRRTQVFTTLPNNVVGLWRFDASPSPNVLGTAGSATLGAGASLIAGQTGFGQTMHLTGAATSQARVPDDASLDMTNNFTVEAWIRPTDYSASTNSIIVQKAAGGCIPATCNYTLEFTNATGKLAGAVGQGASQMRVSSVAGFADTLMDGRWHHVALTMDSSNLLALYADGVQLNTLPAGGVANTNANPLGVGTTSTGSGLEFVGDIDEVRISSVARSAAEILGYYNTKLPHYTTMWDSSPTDAGVAIASCATGVRCANATYGAGGGQLSLFQDRARYYTRMKYRSVADPVWSLWGSDWFEMRNLFPNGFLTQGATQPTNVATATPTFSAVNNLNMSVDQQRTQVYNDLDTNVRGLWHLDNSGAPAIGDPALMTASLGGAATWNAASDTDLGNTATMTGAAASKITIPASRVLHPASDFTVDLWFRTSNITNTGWPLLLTSSTNACSAGTDCNYGFFADSAGGNRICAVVTTTAGGNPQVKRCSNFSSDIADGAWHHAAMTVSATLDLSLYFDGALQGTSTTIPSPIFISPTSTLNLGGGGITGNYVGTIDEVRVKAGADSAATIAGYYRSHRPHFTKLWDSSPTDAGVAMTACAPGARCPDVTYGTGGGQLPINRDGARYTVLTKFRNALDGTWSTWGSDWFQTQVTPSISVTAGTVNLGTVLPGADATGTTTVQVTTNDDRGYLLTARYSATPLQNGTGGTVPAFVPSAGPASVWPAGSSSGVGMTVLGASGGAASRLAQWGIGTGTSATDFVNNYYAGLSTSTDTLVHRRTTYFAGQDNVDVGFRVNFGVAQAPGAYSTVVAFTAVAPP